MSTPGTPNIVWKSDTLRIVRDGERLTLEKAEGRDALGGLIWHDLRSPGVYFKRFFEIECSHLDTLIEAVAKLCEPGAPAKTNYTQRFPRPAEVPHPGPKPGRGSSHDVLLDWFKTEEAYRLYLVKLRKHKIAFSLDEIAYCLSPADTIVFTLGEAFLDA